MFSTGPIYSALTQWLVIIGIVLYVGKVMFGRGLSRKKATRLFRLNPMDFDGYLRTFEESQLIWYIRGITDRRELERASSACPSTGDMEAVHRVWAVARERLDNECPGCGSRKNIVTKSFQTVNERFENETITGARRNHYDSNGEYRGYSEDEDNVLVSKFDLLSYDEKTCAECRTAWNVLIPSRSSTG